MTNAELLDLLREAQRWLPATGQTALTENGMRQVDALYARISSALAERQDSAKEVVEPTVVWWRDKVIRAIINGRHVTIQTNAPNHWFWSVAFVDCKDRYGMCERQDGICTTEAEAKEAAIKMARRLK